MIISIFEYVTATMKCHHTLQFYSDFILFSIYLQIEIQQTDNQLAYVLPTNI